MKSGFFFATTAGLFAALAAVFAKLSLNNEEVQNFICADHLGLAEKLSESILAADVFKSFLNCQIVIFRYLNILYVPAT